MSELETTTASHRSSLERKANGAFGDEELGFKSSWRENTYLQRRLEYLRTQRPADELSESGEARQNEMAGGDRVTGSSVSEKRANLDSAGTEEKPIYIDTVSDDWTWCANPT